MRSRRLKLGTLVDSGQMYHVYRNQAAALIRPFISSIFFLSNFQHWNFSSHFSQEVWDLEDWKLVHMWTVGRCIMCTRIRLLLLIQPFISSFFFCSKFQHWNFSSHFSQGTVRPRRLKLGTHMDSGQMYRVYWKQAAAAAYSSLYFFIFLSLQFSNIKIFVTLFSGTVRLRRLKLGTHVDIGQIYHIYRNQAAAAYSSRYFFIFLSPFIKHQNFFHIFLRNFEV